MTDLSPTIIIGMITLRQPLLTAGWGGGRNFIISKTVFLLVGRCKSQIHFFIPQKCTGSYYLPDTELGARLESKEQERMHGKKAEDEQSPALVRTWSCNRLGGESGLGGGTSQSQVKVWFLGGRLNLNKII